MNPVVLRAAVVASVAARAGRPPRGDATGRALADPAAQHADALRQGRERGGERGQEDGREQGRAQGHEEGYEEGHAQGLRSGFEEGLRQGREQARAQLEEAVAQACEAARREAVESLAQRERALAALIAALDAQAAAVQAAAQDDLAALCFEVLCRVVGQALLTPEGVRAQALQALAQAQAGRGAPVTLRLHPVDVQQLEAALHAPDREPAWPRHLALQADADIGPGGCRVENGATALDARLDTVLAQCRQALLEARARLMAPAGGGA